MFTKRRCLAHKENGERCRGMAGKDGVCPVHLGRGYKGDTGGGVGSVRDIRPLIRSPLKKALRDCQRR